MTMMLIGGGGSGGDNNVESVWEREILLRSSIPILSLL